MTPASLASFNFGRLCDDVQITAELAMRLGSIPRATLDQNFLPESVATHTVMLCWLAAGLARHCGLDPELACMYAVVHDAPEALYGHTNTLRASVEEKVRKAKAEEWATRQIAALLSGHFSGLSMYLALYQAQATPEARFIRCLDKITPKLTHLSNGGESLKRQGVSPEELNQILLKQSAELGPLFAEFPLLGQLHRWGHHQLVQMLGGEV